MNFKVKQSALIKIYSTYDIFCIDTERACKKGCAQCCTRNVILTSLEAINTLTWLISNGKTKLLDNFLINTDEKHFIPKLTINGLAALCLSGQDLPDEQNDPLWGKCPFLNNNMCTVYEVRPFACRSMGSYSSCQDKGYAELDDFIITVNEVFMQYIEHIDQNGFTGNMIDMLIFFNDQKNIQKYKEDNFLSTPKHILRNTVIPALMIPPQYREKIKPLLAELTNSDI